jgi:uncharacterized protein YdhG (YjbR/CyaY superfamily)
MPDFILQALKQSGLFEAYQNRPSYQQNDYIGWINRAAQEATRQKRLDQMLEELRSGDTYMKMAYKRSGEKAVEKEAPAASVDEYIATAPPEMRPALEDLRRVIKETAPEAEELICYHIPTYRYHGSLVHFQAHKSHISFITVNKQTLEQFKDDLKGFKYSGTTIHFTPQHPLPAGLVKKIVQARMRENETRS